MHDVCICSCVNDDDVVCISGCIDDDVFTAVCCLTVLMTPATLSHSKWGSDRSSKVSRNKKNRFLFAFKLDMCIIHLTFCGMYFSGLIYMYTSCTFTQCYERIQRHILRELQIIITQQQYNSDFSVVESHYNRKIMYVYIYIYMHVHACVRIQFLYIHTCMCVPVLLYRMFQ